MGYNTNRIKKRAEELSEGYQEAKDDAFNDEFRDTFSKELGGCSNITEDDLQGFLDSFSFPDESEWSFDAVQSELDDIGDQKMEEERDRRIGL